MLVFDGKPSIKYNFKQILSKIHIVLLKLFKIIKKNINSHTITWVVSLLAANIRIYTIYNKKTGFLQNSAPSEIFEIILFFMIGTKYVNYL